MLDGRDPMVFTREVAAHLRTILIAQETGDKVAALAQITGDAAKRFIEQGKRFESRRLMRAMNEFIQAEGNMRYVAMPCSVIEMCAVKSCRVSNEKTSDGLIERIEALEKQLREGTVTLQPRQVLAQTAKNEKTEEYRQEQSVSVQARQEIEQYDNSKQLFDEAIERCRSQLPMCAYWMSELQYRKTEGNIIYASVSNDKNVKKNLLDRHGEEIEKIFRDIFQRPVKLNISVSESAFSSSDGISAAMSTEAMDVFGREHMEYGE